MTIDWVTVAAQIVNFLVLVWLLHRFLYGPIIRAMDRREQRIADRLRDAAEKREQAEREAQRFEREREELEEKRAELLREAEQEADERRKQLEEEARNAIEERREAWRRQLEEEEQAFLADIRRKTAEQFCDLARKALRQLANQELENEIASVLTGRLKELEQAKLEKMAQAADETGMIEVRSGFELASGQRRQLTRLLHDRLSSDVEVNYRQVDDIACGVEIRAGGQTLRWSLDGYLDRLEEELSGALSRRNAGDRDETKAAQ